jgi:hypothetical protein
MLGVQCAVCSVQRAVCSVQRAVCIVQCAVCSVCVVCRVPVCEKAIVSCSRVC